MSAVDPLLHRRRFERADIDALAAAARSVLARHPTVIAAYLYGSAARGQPAADLDVGLAVDGPIAHGTIEAIAAALQAAGAPGGPDIDLRVVDPATPRFAYEVIRTGLVLHERDAASRARFEARAIGAWLDFEPVWTRMRDRARQRWLHG